MGNNDIYIKTLPSKQELNTLASACARQAAKAEGTPFTLEAYWQWLEKSDYYKYVNFQRTCDHYRIINFGMFKSSLTSEEIYLRNDGVIISLYSTRLPFKTLEGAIDATTKAIDLMLGKYREDTDASKIKKHYEELFAEKTKGSNLIYDISINCASHPWKGTIKVKLLHRTYLIFTFSAATKDSAFNQMACYATEYKHLLEKYSMFNSKIRI